MTFNTWHVSGVIGNRVRLWCRNLIELAPSRRLNDLEAFAKSWGADSPVAGLVELVHESSFCGDSTADTEYLNYEVITHAPVAVEIRLRRPALKRMIDNSSGIEILAAEDSMRPSKIPSLIPGR